MDSDLELKRILIIDDEPDALIILRVLLEKHGATVFCACNGREGFDVARRENLDLILSDISMPGVNGWDFIRLIRQFPQTAKIPVVAVTAHTDSYYRRRASAAGFRHFIAKPINARNFVEGLKPMLV